MFKQNSQKFLTQVFRVFLIFSMSLCFFIVKLCVIVRYKSFSLIGTTRGFIVMLLNNNPSEPLYCGYFNHQSNVFIPLNSDTESLPTFSDSEWYPSSLDTDAKLDAFYGGFTTFEYDVIQLPYERLVKNPHKAQYPGSATVNKQRIEMTGENRVAKRKMQLKKKKFPQQQSSWGNISRKVGVTITNCLFHTLFCSAEMSLQESVRYDEMDLQQRLGLENSSHFQHMYKKNGRVWFPSRKECGVVRLDKVQKQMVGWMIVDRELAHNYCKFCKSNI